MKNGESQAGVEVKSVSRLGVDAGCQFEFGCVLILVCFLKKEKSNQNYNSTGTLSLESRNLHPKEKQSILFRAKAIKLGLQTTKNKNRKFAIYMTICFAITLLETNLRKTTKPKKAKKATEFFFIFLHAYLVCFCCLTFEQNHKK